MGFLHWLAILPRDEHLLGGLGGFLTSSFKLHTSISQILRGGVQTLFAEYL